MYLNIILHIINNHACKTISILSKQNYFLKYNVSICLKWNETTQTYEPNKTNTPGSLQIICVINFIVLFLCLMLAQRLYLIFENCTCY